MFSKRRVKKVQVVFRTSQPGVGIIWLGGISRNVSGRGVYVGLDSKIE